MRDDRLVPEPSTPTTAKPPSAVEVSLGADVDQSSLDAQPDTPAALSAISHPADAEELGLSDEEIAMYRRRVAEGMYNSREVAAEVARRMMRRGDI